MEGTANTKDRRLRGLARPIAALVVLAATAGGVAAAGACLPELGPLPEEDASLPPLGRFCGNNLIEIASGSDKGESCDPGQDAQAGCENCTVTCEPGGVLDPTTGHCYFVAADDVDSFFAARAHCKQRSAHIVTFASAQELAYVEAKLGGAGYWIGLEPRPTFVAFIPEQPEEPGYPFTSNGPCPGCFGAPSDGGPFTSDGSGCIASAHGEWFGVPCNNAPKLRAICEREPVGSRSDFEKCFAEGVCFSVARSVDKKQFVVVLAPTSEPGNASECTDLDGGSPAIFDSPEEREEAAHEIVRRLGNDVELWIGLVEDGGRWQWADGVPADAFGSRPAPWGKAQPDGGGPGARAFMRLSAEYDTQLAHTDPAPDASVKRNFLCQRSPQ